MADEAPQVAVTQVLACVPTSDPQLQNPPCRQGSALVTVDPAIFRPDPYEGADYGAGIVLLIGGVSYMMGRSIKVVKGL